MLEQADTFLNGSAGLKFLTLVGVAIATLLFVAFLDAPRRRRKDDKDRAEEP